MAFLRGALILVVLAAPAFADEPAETYLSPAEAALVKATRAQSRAYYDGILAANGEPDVMGAAGGQGYNRCLRTCAAAQRSNFPGGNVYCAKACHDQHFVPMSKSCSAKVWNATTKTYVDMTVACRADSYAIVTDTLETPRRALSVVLDDDAGRKRESAPRVDESKLGPQGDRLLEGRAAAKVSEEERRAMQANFDRLDRTLDALSPGAN